MRKIPIFLNTELVQILGVGFHEKAMRLTRPRNIIHVGPRLLQIAAF